MQLAANDGMSPYGPIRTLATAISSLMDNDKLRGNLMKSLSVFRFLLVAIVIFFETPSQSAEPITLDNVGAPAEISADEPRVDVFSLEQAARSLDTAALDWQKNRACTACH